MLTSTNSQPWRALVGGDTALFYKPKSPISVLDCGIGMSHFCLTEEYLGSKGSFFKADSTPTPPEGWSVF